MEMRTLDFIPEGHAYLLDGKPIISVTTLLRKHGLTPDYSRVNQDTLAYKAMRGTLVHEEIENYIKNGTLGLSEECAYFANHIFGLCESWLSEVRVFCDDYAGTVDLIGMKDNEVWYIDTKTGHVDIEAVRWQVTLYARCTKYPKGTTIRYFVYDAKQDGSNLIELTPIADEDVNRLLEAERKGEIYEPRTLTLPPAIAGLVATMEEYVSTLEEQLKEAKAKRDEYRAEVIKAFEEQGVKEFETEKMKIAYVKPYSKTTLDTDKLKKNFPSAFEACKKETHIKASIRVTLKAEVVA